MISYIVTYGIEGTKLTRVERYQADDISHALEQAEQTVEPGEWIVVVCEEAYYSGGKEIV